MRVPSASNLVWKDTGMKSISLAILLVSLALTQSTRPPAPTTRPAATSPDEAMERLDQPIPRFALEACPLPEAVEKLSQTTGVPIRFKKNAMSQLPWGTKT